MRSPTKRAALTGAFALFAGTGIVVAAAATLGTLDANQLGATDGAIASCDVDGVAIAYTTAYDATEETYQVTGVTVTGIAAACQGQILDLTLADTDGTSIGTATGTVEDTDPLTLTIIEEAKPAAKDVLKASVVISG